MNTNLEPKVDPKHSNGSKTFGNKVKSRLKLVQERGNNAWSEARSRVYKTRNMVDRAVGIREFTATPTQMRNAIEEAVEQAFEKIRTALDIPSRDDLRDLSNRLDQLDKKLALLQTKQQTATLDTLTGKKNKTVKGVKATAKKAAASAARKVTRASKSKKTESAKKTAKTVKKATKKAADKAPKKSAKKKTTSSRKPSSSARKTKSKTKKS